jgi:hypothetical protein
LKEKIYTENKAKVLKFSMKDFGRLFFKFSNKKAIAEASKKKWFAESYEDYLLSKQSQR